jgi:hypothetical protein
MKKLLLLLLLITPLYSYGQGALVTPVISGVGNGGSNSLTAGAGIIISGGVISTNGSVNGSQTPLTNNVNGAGNTISNASFTGNGGGLTNLETGILLSDINSIGTSDDTAVFQAAANLGKTVYIPSGTWISSNITNSSPIHWIGMPGAVILFKAGSTGYLFNAYNNTNTVIIENITFDGGDASACQTGVSGSRSGCFFNCLGGTNSRVENCTFKGFNNNGVTLYSTNQNGNTAYTIPAININNFYCQSNYVGINNYSDANGVGEYLSISGARCEDNWIGGILDAGNVKYSKCNFDGNFNDGAWLPGTSINAAHGSFVGCSFNHNAGNDFVANGLPAGELFEACQFYAGNGSIWLTNCIRVVFTGCDFAYGTIIPTGGTSANICTVINNTYSGTWGANNAGLRLVALDSSLFKYYGNTSTTVFGDNDGSTIQNGVMNGALTLNSNLTVTGLLTANGGFNVTGNFNSFTGATLYGVTAIYDSGSGDTSTLKADLFGMNANGAIVDSALGTNQLVITGAGKAFTNATGTTVAVPFALNISNVNSSFSGIATNGAYSALAQSGSIASVVLYTNTTGGYVAMTIKGENEVTTAATTGTLTVTYAWTNQNGAQTFTPLSALSTAAKSTTPFVDTEIVVSNATSVTVSTTEVNSVGTATYSLRTALVRWQ